MATFRCDPIKGKWNEKKQKKKQVKIDKLKNASPKIIGDYYKICVKFAGWFFFYFKIMIKTV